MSKSEIVYINGEYHSKAEARISILDRGFLFGDGVYELIPVYNGNAFYIESHLERLRSSLSLINIDSSKIVNEKLSEIILNIIKKNNYINHYIYIHISRGADLKRNHIYSNLIKPTVLVMGEDYKPFDEEEIKTGKKAVTENDYRWLKSNIKSTSLLANVLIKNYASDNAAYEALLIRDGQLTEGSASNVFIVKDDVIKTPTLSNKLLPGITRKFLTDLINENNLILEECDITEAELFNADEIFCSSSTNPVVPIVKVNNELISESSGPVSMGLYYLAKSFISNLK